jgi:bis(5'-nucleosyl)-tetraphosphatase (symmetrical)
MVSGACPPERAPAGHVPWFLHPERRSRDVHVAFGHWAALGLWVDGSIAALDTGYVWGGALTAWRIEDGAVFQVLADKGPCD